MKARFLALAAVVLGLASCQTDPEVVNPVVDAEVDFQLSVAAPELATRAGENGAADTQNAYDSAFGAIDYLQTTTEADAYRVDWKEVDLRYTLEVYDKADSYADATPVKDRQVIIKDSYEPAVFDLRLVPNRDYHFVVFADFVAQGEYEKDATAQLSVAGIRHRIGDTLADIEVINESINDEVGDAYFATKDIKVTNSAAQDIVLRRPYGKVRVIATDLAELNLNVHPYTVDIAYDAYQPNTFNAITGTIGGRYQTANYTTTFINKVRDNMDKHVYNAGYDAKTAPAVNGTVRNTHITLATDYILALPEGQTPIHFTMVVKDEAGVVIKETAFTTDIPVERNKLTTVIGNVLTTATEIEVRIDDNFAGELVETLWDGKSATAPAYDDATKTYTIYEESELAWFADQVNGVENTRATANTFKGYTIKLGDNLHLNYENWTPIGATGKFEGTFDGAGFAIEGLRVYTEGKASAGLFANCLGTIKNLTVIDAEIYGHYKAGVIVGDGLCSKIENCHVKDAIVESTPWLTKNGYDDANHVGGIVGYLSAETTAYAINCSVENAKISAYRDVAGIAGTANGAAVVTGNTVENVTVVADLTVDYVANNKAANAGAIAGRIHASANVSDNTIGANISVTAKVDSSAEMNANKPNEEVAHMTLENGAYDITEDVDVNGAIQVNLGGEVVINANDKNINAGTAAHYGFIVKESGNKLVINDANITTDGGSIAAANGAEVVFNGKKIALNSTTTNPRYLFYADGAGSKIVINGGDFSFSAKTLKRAYVYAGAGTRVEINGGTFGVASSRNGYKSGILGDGEVIINGGTFGFDPTPWVSGDSVVNKEGDKWVVSGARFIFSTEQLQKAINEEYIEGQTLLLVNGYYEGHFDFTGKTLKLRGTNGADYIKGMVWADNCNVSFEGVHFMNPDGVQHPNPTNSTYYTSINNQYPLIGAYNNAKLKFSNCTFHISGPTVYGFYGYAHNDPVFEGCRFECNGIRPIANNGDSLKITGCTFIDAYHYAARIYENAGERQTVIFENNTMEGTNTKGEFEGINISKKGSTATVYADFTISGNTANLKYRYHKNVTLDASCTGAELFEKEQ